LYQAGLLYSSMSTQSYGIPFSSRASHTCTQRGGTQQCVGMTRGGGVER
jgi:hypothetical protein